MKVSIFGILCLLMMVLYSHSFPQMSEECSHCGAGHEACWEICLSSYSQDDEYYNKYDDFAFSTNDNMACGKIRTCLKPKFSNKPMCKTAPKELPDRCDDKPDKPTGGNDMSCGRIRACMKPAFRKKPICKNAPKKLPARCGDPITTPPSCNPKKQSCKPPIPPINSGCKCLSKELDFAGLPTGHCLTKDPANDKFYCYVNADSCGDTKPSKRFHNLYYSYQACWNQRAEGYAAPNCDCESWDDQCQTDCSAEGLYAFCEDNPYCWEDLLSRESDGYDDCICEDWDDQCWTDCFASHETETGCDCSDDDDQCWDDCLAGSNSGQIEPTGCYCQDDSDAQCFEHCYTSPVTAEEP